MATHQSSIFNPKGKNMHYLISFSKLTFISLLTASVVAGCGGAVNAHIGGTITGLASGGTVGLTNTANGDTLSVPFNSNDNSFEFSQTVAVNGLYNVTVSTQPTGQVCSVANGIGTVSSSGGDVTNISITCMAGSGSTVPVTASVSGLALGAQLILQGNSVGTLTITGTSVTAAGGMLTQTFPTQLAPGAFYNVTIQSGSPPQCQILGNSGSGSIAVPVSGSNPSPPSPVLVDC